MSISKWIMALSWTAVTASVAAAQDQKIIIDRPLDVCGDVKVTATLTPEQAASVIKAAMNISEPSSKTYYIIHATEYLKTIGSGSVRMTVSTEHWYVFHAPWQKKKAYLWVFTDSRQFKHFKETRIFGSSDVALVYLYINVPTYQTRNDIHKIAEFFLKNETKTQADLDRVEAEAGRPANRKERLDGMTTRLKDDVPADAEARATSQASGETRDYPDDLKLIAWLETERYLRALYANNTAITDEFSLVNQDTGDKLVGLSPELATVDAFKPLSTLFYRIDVTKKIPAPLQNLRDAAKIAFGGQAAIPGRIGVKLNPDTQLCAGASMTVKPLPSDMVVKALSHDGADDVEHSKQTFDNEAKSWWDVSFALPLDLRRDLTVDVDAGQVAAKSVEKTDLFAVVNLGARRDTKKPQWQLIPTFIYGVPITGKPLHHHLVGFTVGLNYVQLIGGWRIDRKQGVATSSENGTPVGVETTPTVDKWEKPKWVWGVNIPVGTVTKLLKKDD